MLRLLYALAFSLEPHELAFDCDLRYLLSFSTSSAMSCRSAWSLLTSNPFSSRCFSSCLSSSTSASSMLRLFFCFSSLSASQSSIVSFGAPPRTSSSTVMPCGLIRFPSRLSSGETSSRDEVYTGTKLAPRWPPPPPPAPRSRNGSPVSLPRRERLEAPANGHDILKSSKLRARLWPAATSNDRAFRRCSRHGVRSSWRVEAWRVGSTRARQARRERATNR
mmetsp:Transcript_12920/g.34937  ORF Transcript_12920/g.34937 Transcript_12920/m.34937 type:complete len:221 (-) Transcript_12920:83-745(-)